MSEKKKPSVWSGYAMFILAGFCFSLSFYIGKPLHGENMLLVATEKSDENFEQSVILLYYFKRFGAEGVILNKGDFGGPIDKARPTIVHSNDIDLPGSEFDNGLGLGITHEPAASGALKEAKKKPKFSHETQGVARWRNGRLEKEIEDGHWQLLDYDRNLVYDTPPAKLWAVARKRAEAQAESERKKAPPTEGQKID